MGSLRTIVYAGSIVIGLAGPVAAADLLPPAPELEWGNASPVTELGTGWYLRGDVGYVDYAKPDALPYGPATADLQSFRFDRKTYSLGGGIGYKVSNWLRADVTGDFRVQGDVSAELPSKRFDSRFSSTSVLLNGYLDIGEWRGVTPYLGGGIGMAVNDFKDQCFSYSCEDPNGVAYKDASTFNFAWALAAGIAFDLSGFKLDLGYRYANMGEAKTRVIEGFGAHLKAIDAHEARLGFRYMID